MTTIPMERRIDQGATAGSLMMGLLPTSAILSSGMNNQRAGQPIRRSAQAGWRRLDPTSPF
jgi:hypothetical protein